MCVDVLADDDGVVNQNSQDDNESKERHHVQRYVETRKEPEGTKERNWDAETDPERQTESQKQR